jgi:sialic acid synthase SpsE
MERKLVVGPREFRSGNTLVIAEIGTGHGGEAVRAAELVAAAAESGADCAKFQCVFADEILHPRTGSVPLPGGSIRLYDRFKSLELDASFYAEAKAEVERRGMIFLCTPFGLESARLLRALGVELMKIASPELNHLPLLDELASYGLPTILSSGVSTLADIERALARFLPASPPGRPAAPLDEIRGIALLHCVTAYPAPEADYNLRVLSGLSSLFGVPVGVSDHSLDPVLVPALATAVGGVIVEKHICLSRDQGGLDDPIALPPGDFAAMVRAIREAQRRGPEETVSALRSDYGAQRVEAALGDGVKRLAPSEAANYSRTKRSIHARLRIAVGETFTNDNLALFRTEKVLRPGLPPDLLPLVLGRRARREVPSGEGVVWEDVGDEPTKGKKFAGFTS